MNAWQQQFTQKMEGLREQSFQRFDRFVDEVVTPTFEAFREFTSSCDFEASTPQHQKGQRTYKFSLTEDVYVLNFFRARGVAEVEHEWEACVPGQGRVKGGVTVAGVGSADDAWVEACFQKALDGFVSGFGDKKERARQPELVHA